jgi:type IX secretion system PorP/SprF family membrane protein
MNLHKYTFAVLITIAAWADVQAQQKPVLSQYMFSGLVLNPAYAGRHEYTTFTGMYRDQWVNVPGSPTLSTFTAQTGVKGKPIGMGMMISSDRIGVHSNTSAYASYAYYIQFRNGAKFSMGLQGGVDYLQSDWTKLDLPPDQQDDRLFSGGESQLFPNFGTGLFYFNQNYYLGLSVPYLLTNRKRLTDDILFSDVRHSRNYYFTGGVVLDINDVLKFKPSFLLRLEDNMPVAVDLNANLYYNEIIDIGISYRQGDSAIGILGLQLNEYVKFSYAYDWIISKLSPYTNGTHELMLQYRINFNAPRKHRMCPGPLYF